MIRKNIAAAMALMTGTALASAAEISNKYVAEAMQSLQGAEKSVYSRLIEQRSKTHGCKVAKDMTALKADEATIPTVADFQGIVAVAVRALDGGKFADGLDVAALGAKPGNMKLEDAADMLHAYASTSRANYTASVVARAKKSGCSKALEEWSQENGLPLPAQFTRATAEAARKAGKFSYALQSEWPVNKENAPKTDFEKAAAKAVMNRKPYYGEETLGGKNYFSAAYADIATNAACTSCHNDHADSPKRDFKLQDVMGDLVIRIPVL
jgi:hypothetical protein